MEERLPNNKRCRVEHPTDVDKQSDTDENSDDRLYRLILDIQEQRDTYLDIPQMMAGLMGEINQIANTVGVVLGNRNANDQGPVPLVGGRRKRKKGKKTRRKKKKHKMYSRGYKKS